MACNCCPRRYPGISESFYCDGHEPVVTVESDPEYTQTVESDPYTQEDNE